MICVDCKEEKQGKQIAESGQFGAKREWRCLCNPCYDKRLFRRTEKVKPKGLTIDEAFAEEVMNE